MNEAETRLELIDPALKDAGWGKVENSRIRCEVIAPGRLVGSGKRANPEKADYVLVYRGEKLAVIEAKKRDLPDTAGLQQAKNYAQKLDTPFAYSTNGLRIYQVEMKTGQESYIDRYPTPDELWDATFSQVNQWRDKFAEVPFEDLDGTKELRYYQHNAVKNFLEALCQGQDRILLTLATGTGKTFIAFQIAWKLFQSRWTIKQFRGNESFLQLRSDDSETEIRRPKILFLADRNILANQAYNDFSAFGGSFGLSSFAFGSLLASCFGCSTSTARGDETISGALFVASPAGGLLIGLSGEPGLIGLLVFVTLVALLTHVLFVSTHAPHTSLP